MEDETRHPWIKQAASPAPSLNTEMSTMYQALENTAGNQCKIGWKTGTGKAVTGWKSQEKASAVCKRKV